MAFKMLLNTKQIIKWDSDKQERNELEILLSKIVKSVMKFSKHTCTEIILFFSSHDSG